MSTHKLQFPNDYDVYIKSNFLQYQYNMDYAIMRYLKNDSNYFLDFVPVGCSPSIY